MPQVLVPNKVIRIGDTAVEIVQIDEPIRVVAVFSGGSVQPLQFDWNGRHCAIEAINGRWIDRNAASHALHFSVQVGGETYYIRFATREVQWRLEQIALD